MLCTTQIPFFFKKTFIYIKKKVFFSICIIYLPFFKIDSIVVRTSDFESIRPGPIPGGCVTNSYLFFHVLFS